MAAPVNTVTPTITGATDIGGTITCNRGTWSGGVNQYRGRLWYRNLAGTDKTLLYEWIFSGATQNWVIPRCGALAGWYLELEVDAINYDGARKKRSAAYGAITDPGGVSLANYLPVPKHSYRAALCDRDGNVLKYILDPDSGLGIWTERQHEYHLGVARMFSGKVPADHANVAGLHTDGDPYLTELSRVLKVWRYERQGDGTWTWDPLFAGQIQSVEPAGDENGVAYASFVAYDPLSRLDDVYTRNAAGDKTALVSWSATSSATIIKTLIDRAQSLAGDIGIDTAIGHYDATPAVDYSVQQQTVAEAIAPLINAYQGCDIWLSPQDRTDGKYAYLNIYTKRFKDRSDETIFAWGTSPFTVAQITNPRGDTPANDVLAVGSSSRITGSYEDDTSKAAIGPWEVVEEYSDIAAPGLLANLAQGRVMFTAYGLERASFIPQRNLAGIDYRATWHVGDFVTVKGGASLLGGISALVRIYGMTMTIDDDGTETITEIITHPEALDDPSIPAAVRSNDMSKQLAKMANRAGRLRRRVTQNNSQLASPIHGVRAYATGDVSLTSGVLTIIPFGGEEYDTDGYHDNVTNNSRLIVPTGLAGYYLINWRIAFTQHADSTSRVGTVLINGLIGQGGDFQIGNLNDSGSQTTIGTAFVTYLKEGDYVQLEARQSSGTTLSAIASSGTFHSLWLAMERIGT